MCREVGIARCAQVWLVAREAALGCEWCLDQNNHQGWYGECFIQALAAAAGLQCSRLSPDCTGVDFDISGPREVRGDFQNVVGLPVPELLSAMAEAAGS